MDAYLDKSFTTYAGVADLIQWCASHDVLFMINTTGMMGYFQRVFQKSLLPEVPVVSAQPLIRYVEKARSRVQFCNLLEIQDKGKNTAAIARKFDIPPRRIILMGDSGGDGPHFQWGAKRDVRLIGAMAKPSLQSYCETHSVNIDLLFGVTYGKEEKRDIEREMQVDFRDLSSIIETLISD
jgi:hypothetical protein